MKYRMFIDDERFPHTPDWFVARNSFQAIKAFDLYGIPTEIAFDHDLGGPDTAMTVVKWLEIYVYDWGQMLPDGFMFSVHSANPIGAKNISLSMQDLVKYSKGEL